MFFLRVKAVYAHGKTTTIFFGLLWLAVLVTQFFIPFHLVTLYFGPGQGCYITKVGYAATPFLLRSAFDTLVFVAISFRIASHSVVGDAFSGCMKSLFRGEGLPNLSRCIIRGGQLYYLFVIFFPALPVLHGLYFSATFGLGLLVAILILASNDPAFQVMFIAPHLAVESAMACRVFRGLKLGHFQDIEECSARSKSIHFAHNPALSMGVISRPPLDRYELESSEASR
jgi:hypothetical protein